MKQLLSDDDLRARLRTLAEQAVPDVDDAAPVAPLRRARAARRRPRVLAAAAVVVLISVVVGVVARSARDSTVSSAHGVVTRLVAPSPLSPRREQAAVAIGNDRVFVWGGIGETSLAATAAPTAASSTRASQTLLADGAIYDTATNRWRTVPKSPLSGRRSPAAVWTGHEIVVTGGGPAPQDRNAAAYDPVRNAWRLLPKAPTCPRLATPINGDVYILGQCGGAATLRAAVYNARFNRWSQLPAPPANGGQFVTVGSLAVLWGGITGASYDPETGVWTRVAPIPREIPEVGVGVAAGRLVAVGLAHRPTGPDVAAIFTYDFDAAAWSQPRYVATGPPLDATQVVSSGDTLVWQSAGLSWSDVVGGTHATLEKARGIDLERAGASLVALGDHRFLYWGGQVASRGPSSVSNDGVVLTIEPASVFRVGNGGN